MQTSPIRRGPANIQQTSDPDRASRNLDARERYFVERLRTETRDLGLQAITVDSAVDESESIRRVSERFGLS